MRQHGGKGSFIHAARRAWGELAGKFMAHDCTARAKNKGAEAPLLMLLLLFDGLRDEAANPSYASLRLDYSPSAQTTVYIESPK